MNSGIYCIENIFDGKKYIGYTTNLEKRKKYHYERLRNNSHINKKMQSAWNKYGENNFLFRVIIVFPKIVFLLKIIEIFFIKVYNSYGDNGYNLTKGGEGNNGLIMSDEAKIKISKSQIGRKHSDETKKKMSLSRKGKSPSKESIEKSSNSRRGMKQSEEHRLRNSECRRGKKSNSTQKYVGVHFDKTMARKKRWRASIRNLGKVIRIGRYMTELEAAEAYDKKSWELYHNKDYLNFPERYKND